MISDENFRLLSVVTAFGSNFKLFLAVCLNVGLIRGFDFFGETVLDFGTEIFGFRPDLTGKFDFLLLLGGIALFLEGLVDSSWIGDVIRLVLSVIFLADIFGVCFLAG